MPFLAHTAAPCFTDYRANCLAHKEISKKLGGGGPNSHEIRILMQRESDSLIAKSRQILTCSRGQLIPKQQ